MNLCFWLGLLSLTLAELGFAANIYSGFTLTQTINDDSTRHLTIALSSICFLVLGSVLVLMGSKRRLEESLKTLLRVEAVDPRAQIILQAREAATSATIVSGVIAIFSLISGTISQSGRFPWIHGASGIVLTATNLWLIGQWWKFSSLSLLK